MAAGQGVSCYRMKPLLFLLNLVLFLIPAGVATLGARRLARTSRDEWQLLAFAPVIPLALWGVFVAWGVTRDPTSHNLWPFELVIWLGLSLVLFGGFLLARRLFGGLPDDLASRPDRRA